MVRNIRQSPYNILIVIDCSAAGRQVVQLVYDQVNKKSINHFK